MRYGGAMGCSSVACAATDFVFFSSSIHKLVERWDICLNGLGGYVENESRMPKEFTFEDSDRKKITCICLTCSFLLVTPRPDSVAVGKYFTG